MIETRTARDEVSVDLLIVLATGSPDSKLRSARVRVDRE
jgi:hypothetical protein